MGAENFFYAHKTNALTSQAVNFSVMKHLSENIDKCFRASTFYQSQHQYSMLYISFEELAISDELIFKNTEKYRSCTNCT